MRLEQIIAWSPIAAIRPGKTDDKPRKSKASPETLGLAEGDVRAVGPAVRRPQDEPPTGDHAVDIRV